MDDKELIKINWPVFLLITGFCFLLFNKALYWLEGYRQPVFNWIGFIVIAVGLLSFVISLNKKSENN
jgi:hypothetical protein